MGHENDCDTNCNWWTRNNPQRIGKGIGKLGNKRKRGDDLNNNIVEIGCNADRSPRDLRRLAVTEAPVENHPLVEKSLKRSNDNNNY